MAMKIRLEKEEADLLKSVEAGEWTSTKDLNREIKLSQEYARATFRRDRRVNIRMSEKDLRGLQKRALQEGIPYQTLISSVLHKYLSGSLVER